MKPHHILRTVHCRSFHLLNQTQHSNSRSSPLTRASPLNKDHALHAGRLTCLKPETRKVQPYVYERCFSTQPVSSEDGVLIYKGNLGKAVLGVKFFSYSTSMLNVCLMPYILMKTGFGVDSFALKVVLGGFVGFFTFITPVLFHLVTKSYVLRLYHNTDTDMYTAITYNVFLVEKKSRFHQSDVTVPDVRRLFTTFFANKHSMLVDPMLFEWPQDYNHLMGYDRPFSFDLDDLKKPDKH